MLTGGCHCGQVRYEASGPRFDETSCHCSICRRTSGAPFVAWFSVPRAGLRLTGGAPTRYASSPRATRSFCPRCGTQLFFEHADLPGEIDISIGSLDDPNAVAPRDHIHIASRVAWLRLADGLPEFPAGRP